MQATGVRSENDFRLGVIVVDGFVRVPLLWRESVGLGGHLEIELLNNK